MILSSVLPVNAALSVGACAAYAVSALLALRSRAGLMQSLLLCAWALHGLVLLFNLLGWGGQALHFGFAPALSVTVWLVITLYGLESRLQPQLQGWAALAVLGVAAVLLALLFQGNALHPSASIWLPLHWALGIASYGLFAAAVLNAWLMTRAEKQMRLAFDHSSAIHPGVPLLALERMTFRFVLAGFVLLSATVLAGGLFTEALYGAGKTAKWDHKTIFSLLSWLTFALLLVGRARFGWRGRKAVRVLYLGAGLLLLAYAGSRFVLEVVLGRTV